MIEDRTGRFDTPLPSSNLESPDPMPDVPASFATALAAAAPPTDLTFEGDDVFGVEIRDRRFAGCVFQDCDFEGSRFVGCSFVDCRFGGCKLRGVRFVGCKFGSDDERPAQWRFCDLSQAHFEDCNLSLNQIVGCTAVETTFDKCSCLGLKFDAEVQRRVGRRKVAGGVRFEGCRLQFAAFTPADYSDSLFESCDLRDVEFARGNFSRASFRGSTLHNADFHSATLDEATLVGATFDRIRLATLFSYQGLTVSPDQQSIILAALGIRVSSR